MDNLEPLIKALSRLRDEAPEMPISIVQTFLGVAQWSRERGRSEPLALNELSAKVGLPPSTVSRHLRYAGLWERPGKAGLGWVDTDELSIDRRQKSAYLTLKGKRIVEQLEALLGVRSK